ncbi:hypothetical protein [Nostoc sp.]|uniref:hypothetical protein n=1 Tax=Nostoc sp. TaxID=1180 RepID=UPI003FA59FB9
MRSQVPLARLDRQHIPLRHELCCLNDIVNDLIEEFAAIAKAIIHAHQGNLNVQSQLGKGSTFTIQLPFNVTQIYQFKLLYRRQPKFK